MNLDDFAYELPEELIAQEPLADRDTSRLLVVDRARDTIAEHVFAELPAFLQAGDLVVLNDSRVFPARLAARRRTGARIELLLLRSGPSDSWRALVRPGKAVRDGEEILLADGTAVVVGGRALDGASCTVTFPPGVDPFEVADRLGTTPLPPYVRRPATNADRGRYQTVYARERGSSAAPTAGLHFTPALLDRLRGRGADIAFVTLHVGAGTFLPVRTRIVEAHRMHEEFCRVEPSTFAAVERARGAGGRVVAVGTTVARTLETALRRGSPERGYSGWTDLFIYPGFVFEGVDVLLTNFHLPRSTLLLLVCAFAGRERVLRAYQEAVERRFRFYSYGDAMLIL
jgi:S-adenosylmethionine:tRNA ribosyltransferase-isomerase